MKLGLAGLGKMGSQVARKLLESGHELVVDSRHLENTQPLIDGGAGSFSDYVDLVRQLGGEPVIWLMIQNEKVPQEIDKLLELLPAGGVIVDGGNSNFKSTVEQAAKAKSKGVYVVDVGTSGGVWGEKQGFSMMIGGDEEAVAKVTPLLDTLAQPNGGWHHFGQSGAGHFVKMVHNGIEYGVMQSYAEGFRLMKEGPITGLDLGKVAEVWQKGSINQSFLNGLVEHMLKENPELDGVEGVVAESGEARWTLDTARELGIPAPAIESALETRVKSQQGEVNFSTKFLAQLRNEFGGHSVNPEQP